MTELKRRRKLSNLSQTELGAKLGVSKQMVSVWENGKMEIDLKHAQKIKQIFNLSDNELSELMGSTPELKTSDFILSRITEIYAKLDRAERAELLAAAERILEKRKG